MKFLWKETPSSLLVILNKLKDLSDYCKGDRSHGSRIGMQDGPG
jgi:hypothetical protein